LTIKGVNPFKGRKIKVFDGLKPTLQLLIFITDGYATCPKIALIVNARRT
jgi:hypothetical protein